MAKKLNADFAIKPYRNRPIYVIGVAGATAVGKSTVADGIIGAAKKTLNSNSPVVARVIRAEWFDYDTDEIFAAIRAWRTGLTVTSNHNGMTFAPAPVMIIDCDLLFLNTADANNFDLKIHVQCDADIALVRRIRQYGSDHLKEIIDVHISSDTPAHANAMSQKNRADIIVDTTHFIWPKYELIGDLVISHAKYALGYTEKK
jgi:uridine kinase